jgi:Kef-type K+ transport system membrane component KefB/voltage-gated potassium channel Kch/Ca2+-binding EF-hand superfamily protein
MIKEAGEEVLGSLGQDVLTFLAATVAVVPVSRILKITPVLLFLVAGFILGPNCLGIFANSEADLELGDFGILFLLFSEGLNLSPERIRDLGAFYGLGVLQILSSMFLLFFGIILGGPLVLEYVAPVINMDPSVNQIFSSPVQAFCIASAGALSSSAFVLPVLKAKKWEDRPEGIAALSVLLLQDLAVAPLLVILPLLAGAGPQTGAELGILAAKATIGFGFVLAVGSVLLRYVFDVVAAARSTETFVAAALLVALGMGQAAERLGLSATTGAFAAGVLLAGNRYRAQIKADVRPFEGILLGIFFMTAGASLDPSVIIPNLPTLLLGMLVFIIIKAAVLFVAGPALGKSWAGAARVAITLSGGGEFSLVLFKLAQELDVLPDELAKLLQASVIISMSLTPLLGELADATGNYLESLEVSTYLDDDGALTPGEAAMFFDRIDTDNSGSIDFEELRIALMERGLSYAAIAEVFTAFDENEDGIICKDEWQSGLEAGILASALSVGVEAGTEQESRMVIADDAIVICGFTEFGRTMYNVLNASGVTKNGGVIAFERNPTRVSTAILSGASVIYGDGASADLMRAAGVRNPKGVIISYRSEARRIDAIERLRDALPPGTPIYARVISGQSLGIQALLDAGATDVVDERAEAAIRFATLLGVIRIQDETEEFRRRVASLTPGPSLLTEEESIPGLSEGLLSDLADEFGCSQDDLIRLNKIFTSLPDGGGSEFVDISELRDVLLRTSKDLIDDETLVKWTELADAECGGTLSFVDFARVYFGSRKEMNISEGGELPAYVGNDSPPSSLKRDSFYNRDSS